MSDYSATIEVAADPEAARRAICNEMDIWWSTRVEMQPHAATIRFNDSHVTFAMPDSGTNARFEWPCTDAHMIIDGVKDADEWLGTSLIWDIQPNGTGSLITLTHKGLNPGIECHDICVRGWQSYFEGSLKDHLEGKAASPERSGG